MSRSVSFDAHSHRSQSSLCSVVDKVLVRGVRATVAQGRPCTRLLWLLRRDRNVYHTSDWNATVHRRRILGLPLTRRPHVRLSLYEEPYHQNMFPAAP